MIIACIIVGAAVLLIEVMLWVIFRRKIEGVCFPSESDHSHFGFFSIGRIRTIALLHTATLIAILITSGLYLW